ncbi:unnamed protein product, partial [Meganyctiphanes norvegica]
FFLQVFCTTTTGLRSPLHRIIYGNSYQTPPPPQVNNIVDYRPSPILRYTGNTIPSILGSLGTSNDQHSGYFAGSAGYPSSSRGNSNYGPSSSNNYAGYGKKPNTPSHPAIDCRSDVLSCVPTAECENDPYKGILECPPLFTKLGGACYYFSNSELVKERSAPDARRFCEDLGGHLLWLENNKEFERVTQIIAENGNLVYWTDGFYDKRKEQWEWYNNSQEIDIRRLHYASYKKPELTSPHPNAQCLSVGSGINAGYCYSSLDLICKMGELK